jgi:hypothetical protein
MKNPLSVYRPSNNAIIHVYVFCKNVAIFHNLSIHMFTEIYPTEDDNMLGGGGGVGGCPTLLS